MVPSVSYLRIQNSFLSRHFNLVHVRPSSNLAHPTHSKDQKKKRIKQTLTSQNPVLSSRPRNGFPAPPSLSIPPAQTFQLIGLRLSDPKTRPTETKRTATRVSSVMSRGRDGTLP